MAHLHLKWLCAEVKVQNRFPGVGAWTRVNKESSSILVTTLQNINCTTLWNLKGAGTELTGVKSWDHLYVVSAIHCQMFGSPLRGVADPWTGFSCTGE